MVMAALSGTGSRCCPSLIADSSIRRIASSASCSRPWVISHRGLSGRLRRTIRITKESAGPARKHPPPALVRPHRVQQQERRQRPKDRAEPVSAVDPDVGAPPVAGG